MNKKIPNWRQAEILRKQYEEWKQDSLKEFYFFPIFETFKETFILRNISGNALRLYIYLGLMANNKTGETWVSINTIAKYFGKSTRTISSWLKELEKHNLIRRLQLEPNQVAHTFLLPYGRNFSKPNIGDVIDKDGLIDVNEFITINWESDKNE